MPSTTADDGLNAQTFASLTAFYPFYLSQHRSRPNRRLHFIGTSALLLVLAATLLGGDWRWLLAAPLCGYGFAWVGHFACENNRPATFKYPLYSFACDFLMYRDMLRGRIPF